jgi:hypothetical protein
MGFPAEVAHLEEGLFAALGLMLLGIALKDPSRREIRR